MVLIVAGLGESVEKLRQVERVGCFVDQVEARESLTDKIRLLFTGLIDTQERIIQNRC